MTLKKEFDVTVIDEDVEKSFLDLGEKKFKKWFENQANIKEGENSVAAQFMEVI